MVVRLRSSQKLFNFWESITSRHKIAFLTLSFTCLHNTNIMFAGTPELDNFNKNESVYYPLRFCLRKRIHSLPPQNTSGCCTQQHRAIYPSADNQCKNKGCIEGTQHIEQRSGNGALVSRSHTICIINACVLCCNQQRK